jgi:hypothetical protein
MEFDLSLSGLSFEVGGFVANTERHGEISFAGLTQRK